MHEGEMVRPCDCAGTMGDVHEECLTKWVTMSNKKNCEICNSPYAKSGAQFKPFKEWSKPGYNGKNIIHIFLIIILAIMIAYVFVIMDERYFNERCIQNDMFSRPDDTGRIMLIIVLSVAIMNNLYTLGKEAVFYLTKQRRIRFIDKHP
uniref:RING-CH-type domain-containing protein n=1 Tax=Caenorhabditis tropicalis TaxID=1561998 RepID=A0A1I7UN59_9PELO